MRLGRKPLYFIIFTSILFSDNLDYNNDELNYDTTKSYTQEYKRESKLNRDIQKIKKESIRLRDQRSKEINKVLSKDDTKIKNLQKKLFKKDKSKKKKKKKKYHRNY